MKKIFQRINNTFFLNNNDKKFLILNKKLNQKNKIYEYIYCDFLMDPNKDLLAKKIELKEWNFTKSYILKYFLREVKKLKIR